MLTNLSDSLGSHDISHRANSVLTPSLWRRLFVGGVIAITTTGLAFPSNQVMMPQAHLMISPRHSLTDDRLLFCLLRIFASPTPCE